MPCVCFSWLGVRAGFCPVEVEWVSLLTWLGGDRPEHGFQSKTEKQMLEGAAQHPGHKSQEWALGRVPRSMAQKETQGAVE